MKNSAVLKTKRGNEMTALLVLNKTQSNDFRILVKLQKKSLIQKVDELLLKEQTKEIFDLFRREGEVNGYYPDGTKLPEIPQLTLIEDMI